MAKLNVGDFIRVKDEESLKDIFKALNKEGYGAVRTTYGLYEVRITSVPKEK